MTGKCWALSESAYDAIVSMDISGRGHETQLSVAREERIGILRLHGLIERQQSFLGAIFGGTSTEEFGDHLSRMIADSSVRSIFIDIDSPGGTVNGTMELASQIHSLRGRKKMTGIVTGQCASAAYWISSAFDELVMTPASQAGSIGVIVPHIDRSGAEKQQGVKVSLIHAGKHKAELNASVPLSSDARNYLQSMVDSYYADFVSAVAKQRGKSTAYVQSNFGQGRMLRAADAVAVGMVDRVGTFEDVLASKMQSSGVRAMLPTRQGFTAALPPRGCL